MIILKAIIRDLILAAILGLSVLIGHILPSHAADNVTIVEASSGTAVGADDVSGVKYQRVKLGVGADGAYGDVSLTNPAPMTLVPSATGGLSLYRSLSVVAAGQSVKGSAGQVYQVTVANVNAAARYLKFYNKATAPSVGTDTPVLTYYLPPTSNTVLLFPAGMAFATGVGIGATTGVADADTGAPSANDVIVNIGYK